LAMLLIDNVLTIIHQLAKIILNLIPKLSFLCHYRCAMVWTSLLLQDKNVMVIHLDVNGPYPFLLQHHDFD